MGAASLSGDPSRYVRRRIRSFHNLIPAACRGRITMAVAVAEAADGTRIVLVATSEARGYLRPGVVLDAGDVLVSGSGHAEQDIVEYCLTNGLKLVDIGATRPICPACAALIGPTGTHISTPLKVV